ncbi:hypothetical protein ACW2Q0_18755 [Nocardia sp. R16R-3T]
MRSSPCLSKPVGQAAIKISTIDALTQRIVGLCTNWKAGDPELPPLVRAEQLMGSVSYSFQLAREAIDLLYLGSGASVIREQNPIQRFQRDIQAFTQHVLVHPDTQFENLGRQHCGLPPFGGAARTVRSTPNSGS